MPRRKLRLFLWTVFAGVFLAAAAVLWRFLHPAPLDNLVTVLKAVDLAESRAIGDAAVIAADSSRLMLARGQAEISQVSGSVWPFHSYDSADSLLLRSLYFAKLADSLSNRYSRNQRRSVEKEFNRVSDSLLYWRTTMNSLLPRAGDEADFSAASFHARLAGQLLQKEQYHLVREHCDSVRNYLAKLDASYSERLAFRKEQARLWRSWIDATLDSSRVSRKHVIIVDKAAHWLYLLKAGRIVDSFKCDLGYNSGHPKKRAGDGSTPEGMYRAVHINNASKYYRVLLIDYPNGADRARFESDRKNRIVPATATIGGLIEIHGDGGTGRDWTDGCVAIKNEEMDKLLKRTGPGTIVTIVRMWEGR